MSKFVTIGVDPGLAGAVGVLVDGEFSEVHSMPLEAKRKGNQVDSAALLRIARSIRQHYDLSRATIGVEQVSANPHQGVSSMFSFGDSFGCARCFAAALEIPLVLVTPARWKGAMRLNASTTATVEKNQRYAMSKRYAMTRARHLFPNACDHLTLSKHEGRAEALLLARYLHDFPNNT